MREAYKAILNHHLTSIASMFIPRAMGSVTFCFVTSLSFFERSSSIATHKTRAALAADCILGVRAVSSDRRAGTVASQARSSLVKASLSAFLLSPSLQLATRARHASAAVATGEECPPSPGACWSSAGKPLPSLSVSSNLSSIGMTACGAFVMRCPVGRMSMNFVMLSA